MTTYTIVYCLTDNDGHPYGFGRARARAAERATDGAVTELAVGLHPREGHIEVELVVAARDHVDLPAVFPDAVEIREADAETDETGSAADVDGSAAERFGPDGRWSGFESRPPAAGRPAADGRFESEAAVEAVLQAADRFTLTYRDGSVERTVPVRHVVPDRPSMSPLRGPPTFWFEAPGAERPFAVRLPDIVDLQPGPHDRESGDAAPHSVAQRGDEADGSGPGAPVEAIRGALADARRADDPHAAAGALSQALEGLRRSPSRDAFDAIVEPTLTLLQQVKSPVGTDILQELASRADSTPEALAPYVPELASLTGPDSSYCHGATRCVTEVAESDAAATIEAVPALATVAEDADNATRGYAFYALSQIAGEYPEELLPAVGTLVDALVAADETIRANATTALGRIAAEHPDIAEPAIADIATLLKVEDAKVRNNAVGLLAEIAQRHPGTVVEHAEALADRLGDENRHTRINASIALLRAGEADPGALQLQHVRLAAALDDADPAVRANACVLVGNSGAPVSREKLRELRANDGDENVREQAAWALERLA